MFCKDSIPSSLTYLADFVEGNGHRGNGDYEDAAGIDDVVVRRPDGAAKNLEEVERIEYFIYQEPPVRFDINGHRVVSVKFEPRGSGSGRLDTGRTDWEESCLLCFLDVRRVAVELVEVAKLDATLDPRKHLETALLLAPKVLDVLMDEITSVREAVSIHQPTPFRSRILFARAARLGESVLLRKAGTNWLLADFGNVGLTVYILKTKTFGHLITNPGKFKGE